MVIAAYDGMENKKKLAKFYLDKANILVSVKNYEEAILYYKYGSTLAEEIVSKEYTIHNCKLVAAYLFFQANYYEEIGQYDLAYEKFRSVPRYISEWSNQFCDSEVTKLLAGTYEKLAEYYFYKSTNYGIDYLLTDALAKGTYSLELFISIIKRQLAADLCYGVVQAGITLTILWLLQKNQEEAKECLKHVKHALKKGIMLIQLSGEEDDSMIGKMQLIRTIEQQYIEKKTYDTEKLFLLFHNYLYGGNASKHKNCIP